MKRAFLCVFALLALLLVSLVITLGLSRAAYSRVAEAEARRYASFKLADELRQSSDDLTRMVRTYASTGQPEYLDYFYEILAIRDGAAPRPMKYERPYWDLVDSHGNRPTPYGEAIPLLARMKAMDFSDEEFEMLRAAKTQSDTLVHLEERAIRAMTGSVEGPDGEEVATGEPDASYARALLYGVDYHEAKSGIMASINTFQNRIEARTSAEVGRARARADLYLNLTWPLGLLAVVLVMFSYVYLGRHAVDPVHELSAHAAEFSNGNYDQHVEASGFSEIGDLSKAFNRMSTAIVRDIEHRNLIQAELQVAKNDAEHAYRRVKRDLEAAAQVQHALLPHQMPDVPGVQFAFAYAPCDELAGDTLNVFRIDHQHIALYLLDVSGHGVQAALLASTLSHVLSPIKTSDSVLWSIDDNGDYQIASPSTVAETLNQRFPMHRNTTQYFTIHYGVLDLDNRMYRFVSGGHPPPVLIHENGKQENLNAEGSGIGIFENSVFEEKIVQLSPGCRVFFFSDGVLEARNESGEEFEDHGLSACLDRIAGRSLDQCMDELITAVTDWSHEEQQDDVSAVAMEIDRRG